MSKYERVLAAHEYVLGAGRVNCKCGWERPRSIENATLQEIHRAHVAVRLEQAESEEVEKLRAKAARVEAALAFTDPDRGVSCGGTSIEADGCFAGDLAARVRAAQADEEGLATAFKAGYEEALTGVGYADWITEYEPSMFAIWLTAAGEGGGS